MINAFAVNIWTLKFAFTDFCAIKLYQLYFI